MDWSEVVILEFAELQKADRGLLGTWLEFSARQDLGEVYDLLFAAPRRVFSQQIYSDVAEGCLQENRHPVGEYDMTVK